MFQYAVDSGAFGLKGPKKVAVVREIGAIVGGGGSREESGRITSKSLVKKLRSLGKRKDIAAVVLRVDSPGVHSYPLLTTADLLYCNIRVAAGSSQP